MRSSLHGHVLDSDHLLKGTKLLDIFLDGKWHVVRLVVQPTSSAGMISLIIDDKSVMLCVFYNLNAFADLPEQKCDCSRWIVVEKACCSRSRRPLRPG